MQSVTLLQQESEDLVRKLIPQLISKEYSLGTAESITGGLICATVTEVPGASQVLKGAVVSYQNSVKTDLLSVCRGRLESHGAVDNVVVEQMAQGAIDTLGVEVAVAVSGVAGPGPAEGKNPGQVWISALTPDGGATMEYHFSGDRQVIRWQTVRQALRLLLEVLASEE